MKRFLLSCTILLASAAVSGCVGHAKVRGEARVHAAPTLVSIGSGVWVVEDYHQPVFYSSGHYWLYDAGIWYRSHTHSHSWVRVRTSAVPYRIVRIERPRVYVHYHARAGARVKHGPKGKVKRRPVVRDHRTKRVERRDHRGKRATVKKHRSKRRRH